MTASILFAGSMTWPLRINKDPGLDLLFVIYSLLTAGAKARSIKMSFSLGQRPCATQNLNVLCPML